MEACAARKVVLAAKLELTWTLRVQLPIPVRAHLGQPHRHGPRSPCRPDVPAVRRIRRFWERVLPGGCIGAADDVVAVASKSLNPDSLVVVFAVLFVAISPESG